MDNKQTTFVLLNSSELRDILEETINNSLKVLNTDNSTRGKSSSPLLSTDELAKQLSVSDQTINRWRQKGKIEYIKFGKSYRYDLEKILLSLEKKSGGVK